MAGSANDRRAAASPFLGDAVGNERVHVGFQAMPNEDLGIGCAVGRELPEDFRGGRNGLDLDRAHLHLKITDERAPA